MTTDLKKSSALFFEGMNHHDLDTIEQRLLSPDVVVHFPGIPNPINRNAFRQQGEAYLRGFPDAAFTILSQLSDGDYVITQSRFEGTQTGELNGIPPTGRKVRTEGVTIDRYGSEGKVIERWDYFDLLGMLIQMGVVPAPNQA